MSLTCIGAKSVAISRKLACFCEDSTDFELRVRGHFTDSSETRLNQTHLYLLLQRLFRLLLRGFARSRHGQYGVPVSRLSSDRNAPVIAEPSRRHYTFRTNPNRSPHCSGGTRRAVATPDIHLFPLGGPDTLSRVGPVWSIHRSARSR